MTPNHWYVLLPSIILQLHISSVPSRCPIASHALIREEMLTPNCPISTTQFARTADGDGVFGDTVFVKTDCSNNARLPLDRQDPAYQHKGVAAPQFVTMVLCGVCGLFWLLTPD